MLLRPRITIQDVPYSAAIETNVKKKINKLNQFYDRIMHCDVIVKQITKNKHSGKLYNTRISITVPGEELAVNRASNEDVYITIRDAFSALQRRLQDFARRRRGTKKLHDQPTHGYIKRLFADEGYGFIESDGNEYYFTFNNVSHPDFEALDLNTEVQFLPIAGDDGLQANRVTVGKHQPLIKPDEE